MSSKTSCTFCKTSEGEPWKEFIVCNTCKKVSKKASKGEGVYFDVFNSKYITGDDIPGFSDVTILDLHGVADLLTPEEMPEGNIIILSYVGSTTNTRITAHDDIMSRKDTIKGGYLCFKKGPTLHTGNKGHFIMKMCNNGGNCTLFVDDSEENCASVLHSEEVMFLNHEEGNQKSTLMSKLKIN
jgi:hypothetical protein